MPLAPLDLLSAHPWERVTFTTYALSLSFFEAVLLDALTRGNAKHAVVLADVHGVRASLSEQGAQRVGKDYEVEPVAVTPRGVFHPKVTVLSGNGECHLLVGSGNLTFNGWGGNCEVLEHLHPTFAAGAFADAADFFELLSVTERIRYGADAHCDAVASDLRAAIEGRPRNGDIRFVHNLDRSISEQLVNFANGLGGATRLLAAAPFWDSGAAIDRLCTALGLDCVYIHAHEFGTVEGTAGANWPQECGGVVHPVRLDIMRDERRLHAKAFEIMCRRGRVLVSGSANATGAALESNLNVEACIVRIQRDRTAAWTFVPSSAPAPHGALKDDTDEEGRCGILRAVLEAETIRGQVLAPAMRGDVCVSYMSSAGTQLIGKTVLSRKGNFEIEAPALEQESWLGGRLVMRVVDANDRKAEGFVSVASFAEITRRAGPAVRSLLAMLAGTETPADVAVIMAWFYEDPTRLGEAVAHGRVHGKDSEDGHKPSTVILVADLSRPAVSTSQASAAHEISGPNWSRFMDHILAAFRQRRGPFGRASAADTDAEDGNGDDGNNNDDDENNDGSDKTETDHQLENFQKLFDLLLKPNGDARWALNAFDLTQYTCDRLRPDVVVVAEWLRRLISTLLAKGVPPERGEDVAAAVLTLLGSCESPCDVKSPLTHADSAASPGVFKGAVRWARATLLRFGFDLSGSPPSVEGVQGFQSVLLQLHALPELWQQVQAAHTYEEMTRSYLDAIEGRNPPVDFAELKEVAREEWPIMEAALESHSPYNRIIRCREVTACCPNCFIELPSGEVGKLNAVGIATAKNCCRKVVILTEN